VYTDIRLREGVRRLRLESERRGDRSDRLGCHARTFFEYCVHPQALQYLMLLWMQVFHGHHDDRYRPAAL
jgi:hypothetical protein